MIGSWKSVASKRNLFVLTILLFALLSGGTAATERSSVPPEDVGMSSARLETLRHSLEQYVAEGELAGGVVRVLRRGEPVLSVAFGYRDLASQDAMEVGDIFRIASQTKALVSVAIMMLEEEGKLLISDPVSSYLPAFESTTVAEDRENGGFAIVPANRPITLRDLLTHTAGVSYGWGQSAHLWEEAGIQGWYFADRDEPIRATVDRIAELPFDDHPGERFIYGYSTDILGAVVEVASGQPLDVFLSERIFEPLGMSDTHFYLPENDRDRLVTVYSAGNDGLVEAPSPGGSVGQGHYVDGPRVSFSGGAGILSTAVDYSRFLQMMLQGGELEGHRLLSPKTVELMTTNHIGDKFPWGEGTGFGLGFSITLDVGATGEHGSVGTYGWGGAYHSTYWVDPVEELVVVYMTNLIPAGNVDDHERLRALVYSAIVDEGRALEAASTAPATGPR